MWRGSVSFLQYENLLRKVYLSNWMHWNVKLITLVINCWWEDHLAFFVAVKGHMDMVPLETIVCKLRIWYLEESKVFNLKLVYLNCPFVFHEVWQGILMPFDFLVNCHWSNPHQCTTVHRGAITLYCRPTWYSVLILSSIVCGACMKVTS